MEKKIRFVWFWTFWHWSKESSRAGLLSHDPLTGIADHWAAWFQSEASEEDRLAIESVGRTRTAQSQFATFLFRVWAQEADNTGSRLVPRFVLGQIARLAPFTHWAGLARYRTSYGCGGIPAIILAENSLGDGHDVRTIQALVLPSNDPKLREEIVTEGFKADEIDLRVARQVALSLLGGKAHWMFHALWILTGRRPYSRWQAFGLGCGWLAVAGLIVGLLLGPDPGEHLRLYCAILLGMWIGLVLVASLTVLTQGLHFWREGRGWARRLGESQTHFHMTGGLQVKGGSAGLAFTLNALLAVYRAYPLVGRCSWIWRRAFQGLDHGGWSWAATGVVTANGWIQSVVLTPKLRACFLKPEIHHVFTPKQDGATARALKPLDEVLPATASRSHEDMSNLPSVGFALEKRRLRLHPCRHAAQALGAIGGLWSRWQLAINGVALAASIIVFTALPDFRSALMPAPPPLAVTPASPSPYYLWVSLDTPHARDFQVVLESRFWINRRVNVVAHQGADASNRAEIRLLRQSRSTSTDPEDGIVWVERRQKFLFREYAPGERVGQYSVSYLNQLGQP